MDFKNLIGKASQLAKEHSDKLGPLGKKAAGLLGKADPESKKAGKKGRRSQPNREPARARRRRGPSAMRRPAR